MKILMLTQVLPYPPDSGPKVKTWNVLKYLARRHEVTLISFVRGDQSESVQHLEKLCKAVHCVQMRRNAIDDGGYLLLSLLKRQPFLMIRDDRAEMRDLVDGITAETHFDIVHADQLNMAQYADRVKGACKVLDEHNAVWLLYKRLWQTLGFGPRKWLLGREWRLLKEYEGRTCRHYDAVLAVSEEDKEALVDAAGVPLNLSVVPIAVDTDEVTQVSPSPEADHILHMGTMYWPPNIDGILWFLREVFPLVQEKKPGTIFDVVGANPPPEVKAFDKGTNGVNVTGYEADPLPYLQKARLMVVPLRAGGGMRVKILNSLSAGVPVVTTSLGSEGIAVENNKHLLVADTPRDFAFAVLRLLRDDALAATLRKNGRDLIETTYDYRAAGRRIEAVYSSATGKSPAV